METKIAINTAQLRGEYKNLFSELETRYNDGKSWKLHYITAREAYNIVKAAEKGRAGDPHHFRDYVIQPYP